VDEGGVPIPDTHLRLRFRSATTEEDGLSRLILLTIEDWAGTEATTIPWLPGVPAADTIRMVMEQLQRTGDYNPGFDAAAIFKCFKDSLRRGVDARTRWTGGPMGVGPIIEVVSPQWALTTCGLECFDHTYPIDKTRLWEEDWLPHMREEGWVDIDAFCEALLVGQAFFASHKR